MEEEFGKVFTKDITAQQLTVSWSYSPNVGETKKVSRVRHLGVQSTEKQEESHFCVLNTSPPWKHSQERDRAWDVRSESISRYREVLWNWECFLPAKHNLELLTISHLKCCQQIIRVNIICTVVESLNIFNSSIEFLLHLLAFSADIHYHFLP